MLSTLNHWQKHKLKGKKHIAKFMPHFDGLYEVTNVHKKASTVTIDVPTQPNTFPTYHISQIKPFNINNKKKYPSQILLEPGPIIVDSVE